MIISCLNRPEDIMYDPSNDNERSKSLDVNKDKTKSKESTKNVGLFSVPIKMIIKKKNDSTSQKKK